MTIGELKEMKEREVSEVKGMTEMRGGEASTEEKMSRSKVS